MKRSLNHPDQFKTMAEFQHIKANFKLLFLLQEPHSDSSSDWGIYLTVVLVNPNSTSRWVELHPVYNYTGSAPDRLPNIKDLTYFTIHSKDRRSDHMVESIHMNSVIGRIFTKLVQDIKIKIPVDVLQEILDTFYWSEFTASDFKLVSDIQENLK